MSAAVAVRPATGGDAAAIARIYDHFVEHTVITFETEALGAEGMSHRIGAVQRAGLPYLVAEDPELARIGSPDAVLGYAYASPFQERAAYRHSVEATVYLAPDAAGRGIGTELYAALLEALRELQAEDSAHAPVHRVYARIALPNPASVALQERFGFAQVATLSEAGRKFARWIDVGFWELALRED